MSISPDDAAGPNEDPAMMEPLFGLGLLMATQAAAGELTRADMMIGLLRHLMGDWGEVAPEDAEENDLSLREGFRIFSVYRSEKGAKFWIITEADRSVTTILLPSDY